MERWIGGMRCLGPTDGGRVRKRVLVCVGSYLPGHKSGGPIRSIANLVANLNGWCDFYVVTRDRDASDKESYPNVTLDEWCKVGNARVLYCSKVGPAILRRALREVKPDFVYLNSFQDSFTRIMVVLRRVGALGNTPVLLAPRGEFSPGAMNIKRTKKAIYRYAAKMLGLHEDLMWHTSTPRESADLLRAAPAVRIDQDSIYVASNITEENASMAGHPLKEPGAVRFVYISRVSDMKNLRFLLEVLPELRGKVEVDIYGSVAKKDDAYWEECRSLLVRLPGNVEAEYRGQLDHGTVPQVLHSHHFFVLPTRGENFCHAAVESFVNGTPAILSDETPWRGLSEARAGFDISLKDKVGWVTALQTCIDMDQHGYAMYVSGAKEYSRKFSIEDAVRQNVSMFEAAIRERPVTSLIVE